VLRHSKRSVQAPASVRELAQHINLVILRKATLEVSCASSKAVQAKLNFLGRTGALRLIGKGWLGSAC
jgi:hypothetical protein